MPKPEAFVDSSVLIAALLSSRGGSFYVLSQLREKVTFQINEYVFDEVRGILGSKFRDNPELFSRLFLLLGLADVATLPNPDKKSVRRAAKVVARNDAPILASALNHSNYLVTLDNGFFQSGVLATAKRKAS